MDIEHDAQFLCLFIERPYFRIVHIGVFRRVELEDLGAFLLDPVGHFLDGVLYALVFDW